MSGDPEQSLGMHVPENLLCGLSVSAMKNASLVEAQGMRLDEGQGHMGHTGCHEADSQNQSRCWRNRYLWLLWSWGQEMTGWVIDGHMSCSKTETV